MNYSDWKIEYSKICPSQELINAGFSPLLATILELRGITNPTKAEEFIYGNPDSICDPFLLKDMDKAVARIHQAIENKENVAVYGDYDVDGITSTCIVSDWLSNQGLKVIPYIPDRIEEGYGLNTGAIDTLCAQNVSLIITVDCGITAINEVQHATSLGVDMIITDHHECKPNEIPTAVAVVNPKRDDCSYPNTELAGVGVALKLISAASSSVMDTTEKYCDLVAIGTVADVMLLTPENRYLVKIGLEKISKSPSIGISALLKASGLENKKITATTIGYTLAPRLNAAGRLGQASQAVNLLMCKSEDAAVELADTLCEMNKDRQAIENEIWKEASSMLDSNKEINYPIVLASEKWHQGVIGIAASKLAEQYSLPTIMICLDEEKGKGSCRSYGGFNIFSALSACSEYLEGFGGHALAAGLTINKSKLEEFKNALKEYYINNPPTEQPVLNCDLLIYDANILSLENVASLDYLEPYGNGNPKPIMCISDATILNISTIGGGKHVRFSVQYEDKMFDCVYFGCTIDSLGINNGERVDIAFSPQVNDFRGRKTVQLVISTIRPHDASKICSEILNKNKKHLWYMSRYTPERADFVTSWKIVNTDKALPDSIEEMIDMVENKLSPEKFLLCLSAWLELGLLTPGHQGNLYGATINKLSEKVSLEKSKLLSELKELTDHER